MKKSQTEILDKSAELFARHGYRKTTLTDIATSLGKVKTAIYYYFTGKEEIFATLVKQESQEFIGKLKNEVLQYEEGKDRIEAYVACRLKLMGKVAKRYNFLKSEVIDLLPLIEKNRLDALEEEIEFVTGLMLANADCLHDSGRVGFYARMVVNTLKSLEIQMYVTDQLPYEQLNEEAFRQFLLYGVLRK